MLSAIDRCPRWRDATGVTGIRCQVGRTGLCRSIGPAEREALDLCRWRVQSRARRSRHRPMECRQRGNANQLSSAWKQRNVELETMKRHLFLSAALTLVTVTAVTAADTSSRAGVTVVTHARSADELLKHTRKESNLVPALTPATGRRRRCSSAGRRTVEIRRHTVHLDVTLMAWRQHKMLSAFACK